ncbi:hypothetical protein TVAG_044800 [Trichomonas vaginalis G3]|uniref:Uncharacterized protein n=1 Tax=Trichomonas vaginalis (strain ATCC PRA-98 / G3) TaxID=412133 RepID=A2E8C8_TRIV3|nr:hypothetical protein TVAGG3_0551230 [Trichomonas vaginalis G3]EAY11056.1 hypothetical protein TVAG_044800 [Trichomonas vaginalis G3]KAI5520522.1 hypothetical protein TVAGG3_0551230 [Trichomonas vaginalis G3]|eukprot:XP_001323279.1 hypothetical protein [Trichomonas vaginalis G3]
MNASGSSTARSYEFGGFYTSRGSKNRVVVTPEQVTQLKQEITQMQAEKVSLKSKIVRMRQIINKHGVMINNVLSEGKERQKLQTATPSAIQHLSKTIEQFKNTKIARAKVLNDLKKSDQYWKSVEIEGEIISLYQEQVRLENEVNNNCIQLTQAKTRVASVFDFIGSANEMNENIDECKSAITSLNKKLASYRRVKQKNPNPLPESQIRKNISNLKMKIAVEEVSTKKTEENADQAIRDLDQIIDDMIARIRDAISKKAI